MSGLSKYTYTTLKQAILDYTEVNANVFTTTILDGFIFAAENRIFYELPMDADNFVQEGTLSANANSINCPAGAVFIRGVEVFESTTVSTGPGQWLEKKDQTSLSEYVSRLTGPGGFGTTGTTVTGLPKYYAMFGGDTGETDITSGALYLAPTPSLAYIFRVYYTKRPLGLGSGLTGTESTYVSTYFSQGLLYACLVEAYGFLKGPTDMLTLYEQKYKTELQNFGGIQLGRRKRDDYTNGDVRIKVNSPSP
jgi:hypothetical protein